MTLRRLLPAVLLLLLPGLPGEAAAQECAQGRVSHLFIDNHSIFDLDELPTERLEWVYRLVNSLHIRTRPSLIRKELVVEVGDCYDPFLLADSERILRRFPFISAAEVYGLRQPDGSWHVIADTRDEWSTRLEVTAGFENGFELRRVALAERNFLGYGVGLKAFFVEDDASRQIGGEVSTPRFAGTETDLTVAGGQTRIGSFYSLDFYYPFVGEVGRWGWRAFGSFNEDYFDYSSGSPELPGHVLLPLRESLAELSLARRFGEPGNLYAVGLALSWEDLSAPDFPGSLRQVRGNDFGDLSAADSASAAQVRPQTAVASRTQLSVLLGHRSIRFIERSGLDALRGVSDVEIGSDVSLTVSRTVAQGLGSGTPSDLGARLRLYAGTARDQIVLVGNLGLDGRQVFFDPSTERNGWRDVLAEVDVLAYFQPSGLPRHTFLARLAGVGGWMVDRPYQITLGGNTGIRGYEEEDFPGARRLVLNLEDRIYLGWPFPGLFDLGLTFFADAGRVWGGDVPFGGDSGWRGSLGGGLRVGFPAGSRNVARLDLAWPVGPGGVGTSPVLRIALVDLIGLQRGFRHPQLERTRLLSVGPDRFIKRR